MECVENWGKEEVLAYGKNVTNYVLLFSQERIKSLEAMVKKVTDEKEKQ